MSFFFCFSFDLEKGKQSKTENLSKLTDAAFLAVGLDPGQVRELRVDGHAEDLRVELLEVARAVGEGGDF